MRPYPELSLAIAAIFGGTAVLRPRVISVTIGYKF